MIALPARAVVRFRYLVIVLWIAVAAFAIARASHVHDVLEVEGRSVATEATRAQQILRTSFPQPFTHFFAVTISATVPLDSVRYQQVLRTLTEAARREPYIEFVVSALESQEDVLVSADERTTFFLAGIAEAHADTATDLVPAFRQAIHRAADRVPARLDYDVNVTGAPALDYDVRTVSKDDTDRGEATALPLAAGVLVVAFGALVAALIPVVVGILAIFCALALVHVAAGFHPMSVFVLNIVTMIGLGVGIDYSLLMVTRFREELNRGLGRRDAAVRTIQTAGRAVVTSGLTVIVGFAGLLVIPMLETRSVAIGGLIVVTVAVLLSVTLLPAVLAVLGRTIDVPKGLASKLAWYHAPTPWERWARWLGNHPWRALGLGLLVAGVITWPVVHVKIGLPRTGWFPSDTESGKGVQALEGMGARGVLQPIRVVLREPNGAKIVGTRYLRGLQRLADSIATDPRVGDVRGAVNLRPGMSILRYSILYSDLDRAREQFPELLATYLSEDGSITRMDVLLADTTTLTGAMDAVRRVREVIPTVPGLDGVDAFVGGFHAASVDLQNALLRRFPLLAGIVLVVTAVALGIAFESVLVPLKAIVMNGLSVAGAFGLIVLVFQQGVGAGLFGLSQGTEAIYVLVPVLVFAIVFGLSMDYEVFLLSRIKEAFDRSGRNSQATMEGLSATASVITSAAAIMIIVFGTFSFSRIVPIQLIGFGLAAAVFLDATLVRMVLVPAFMHIAGRWNWWPGVRGRPPDTDGQGDRRTDALTDARSDDRVAARHPSA